MKVLVGTLTYQRLPYLQKMLETLTETTKGEKFDHLIINNGCSQTQSFLEKFWLHELTSSWRGERKAIYHNTNQGLARSWNQINNYGLENEYDVIIKADDDCYFETSGWLSAAKKVVTNGQQNIVVGPMVNGLRDNKGGVARYAKTEPFGINVGLTYHLGGICLVATREVIELFGQFEENQPMHNHNDSQFSAKLTAKHNVMFGYLEDYYVSHGPGTQTQEDELEEYFNHRRMQRKLTPEEFQKYYEKTR